MLLFYFYSIIICPGWYLLLFSLFSTVPGIHCGQQSEGTGTINALTPTIAVNLQENTHWSHTHPANFNFIISEDVCVYWQQWGHLSNVLCNGASAAPPEVLSTSPVLVSFKQTRGLCFIMQGCRQTEQDLTQSVTSPALQSVGALLQHNVSLWYTAHVRWTGSVRQPLSVCLSVSTVTRPLSGLFPVSSVHSCPGATLIQPSNLISTTFGREQTPELQLNRLINQSNFGMKISMQKKSD